MLDFAIKAAKALPRDNTQRMMWEGTLISLRDNKVDDMDNLEGTAHYNIISQKMNTITTQMDRFIGYVERLGLAKGSHNFDQAKALREKSRSGFVHHTENAKSNLDFNILKQNQEKKKKSKLKSLLSDDVKIELSKRGVEYEGKTIDQVKNFGITTSRSKKSTFS